MPDPSSSPGSPVPVDPPGSAARPPGVPPRSPGPALARGLKGSGRAARSLGRALSSLWRILRANPLSLVGFILVVLVAVTAGLVELTPGLLGIHYPLNYPGPDLHVAPDAAHPFGTDPIGIDIYSNVMAALPVDLAIGFSIALFSLLFGGSLGLIAGYWDTPRTIGGAVSTIILRITDVFLSFPSLILALAIAATLGRGFYQAILAIMITWWPYYVRLVRGEVIAVKPQLFVTAARAAGVSDLRILFRHILRNILEPIVVYFTMDVGTVLVIFSTISFVGIGVPYPSAHLAEWGGMIDYYRDYLTLYPWTVAAPGLAVFITVLAFSLLGDGLRDVLDPRSRRAILQSGMTAVGPEAPLPEPETNAPEVARAASGEPP